jgi:hypothetical protein
MKSVFISSDKLKLNEAYSRFDVGYGGTQTALMRINEQEKIGFFNIGEKYDNKLTKKGFLLNPRKDLNNDHLITELNECTTYLFLRMGKFGLYYYVGYSKKAERKDATHLLLYFDVTAIPDNIVKELGGFQTLKS